MPITVTTLEKTDRVISVRISHFVPYYHQCAMKHGLPSSFIQILFNVFEVYVSFLTGFKKEKIHNWTFFFCRYDVNYYSNICCSAKSFIVMKFVQDIRQLLPRLRHTYWESHIVTWKLLSCTLTNHPSPIHRRHYDK